MDVTSPVVRNFFFLHFKNNKKICIKNINIILQKILEKVVEVVGGGSVINGAYPV